MNKPGQQEIPEQYEHLVRFLDQVFQKDQSDPQRTNAPACFAMLMERRDEFIGTPLEDAFWNAVSLEAFHTAQNAALIGDNKEAVKNLETAYTASHKGISREWEAYVKSTLCYFKNDTEGLKKEIPNAGESNKILQRLLNGFMARGGINYKEDY